MLTLSTVLETFQTEGVVGAAKLALRRLRKLGRSAAPPAWAQGLAAEGAAFDARLGVETSAWVELGDVAVIAHRAGGVDYIPVSPEHFDQAIRAVPVARETCTFVDLGAGKGRALLLALQAGFARAVGVEFSPALYRVVTANLAKSPHGARAVVTCDDAARFSFPDGPICVYLYNPFGAEVMRAVATNLRASYEANPRPVHVAYLTPIHLQIWKDLGWHVVTEIEKCAILVPV